ncbi:MAG: alcohol dehydrogenase catalytic domain-containing protein [Anaerolineales bacterium]
MQAAVLEGIDSLHIRNVPDPVLEDEYSLILKVHACAVCGSDIRILHHGNPRVVPPQIIGHEIAGEVVAVGSKVTRFQLGDRLATGADVPCGECAWCRDGLANNCAINYAIGYQFPGGFAEYVQLNALTLRTGAVHHIPESLSYAQATLAEPLGCCINGAEQSHIRPGSTVVVIGAGPAGCMLMRLARNLGALKVIAIQRSRGRLEAAERIGGADLVICSLDQDPVQAVLDATQGEGADVVITAASSIDTHRLAFQIVRNRATINLFGGLPSDAPPLDVASNIIHYKELTVTGSHGSVDRHHRLALEYLATRTIDPDDYITHHFSLDEIDLAIRAAEGHDGMKAIVYPHGLPPEARRR